MPELFVVGDSISIQYGPYLKQMLAGICTYARKAALGQPSPGLSYPADANGGDSAMVLAYLRHQVQKADFSPDYLLLNCGLHDIKTDPQTRRKQVSLQDYKRNLRQILALVSEKGLNLIWARTTPVDDVIHNSRASGFQRYNQDIIAYNDLADKIFGQERIPIIDLYTFTLNLAEDVYYDHVHFTEAVCAKQGAFIAGFVTALTQRSHHEPKRTTEAEIS